MYLFIIHPRTQDIFISITTRLCCHLHVTGDWAKKVRKSPHRHNPSSQAQLHFFFQCLKVIVFSVQEQYPDLVLDMWVDNNIHSVQMQMMALVFKQRKTVQNKPSGRRPNWEHSLMPTACSRVGFSQTDSSPCTISPGDQFIFCGSDFIHL